ncbi:MAG TPA: dihydrolipoyl dehydrogenase [Candidatus Binatia bacterium]|jgi:dihydrolipoamide dehydrogenase|nr:dihydrolipoyl dehydrogenase [Candidatus Binatia bacterium]
MESIKSEIVVLGAGPGGYTAAFYAADRGKKVTLVEQSPRLGGICLNSGCIPSKALLHATAVLREAKDSAARGIAFGEPRIDLDKLRAWKESILERLGQGIKGLAQKRNVQLIHGRGHFEDSHTVRIETGEGQKFLNYEKAIIAVGSKPAMPSAFDLGNKRIMTSTEALEIRDIPTDLLVVGGGYIGMELGTVYATLGSNVVVLEALSSILTGVDPDLVRPVTRAAQKAFKEIRVNTKVLRMATAGKQIKVTTEIDKQQREELYDRVLVSVGRAPNYSDLGLENTRVTKDDKGFIKCNPQQQTDDPDIYAIGDVNGGALLAHRASKEARIAVDAILGELSAFENIVIPAVVYTDPEVAWCGLTESEAKQKEIDVKVAKFLWGASGRALTLDRPDGLTKLIIDPDSERILGVGIVGTGAAELISEGVLAVEMGATARDLAESVHPHPTLSETLMEGAEVFYGTATHTFAARRES